jgi:hypothetical protein
MDMLQTFKSILSKILLKKGQDQIKHNSMQINFKKGPYMQSRKHAYLKLRNGFVLLDKGEDILSECSWVRIAPIQEK